MQRALAIVPKPFFFILKGGHYKGRSASIAPESSLPRAFNMQPNKTNKLLIVPLLLSALFCLPSQADEQKISSKDSKATSSNSSEPNVYIEDSADTTKTAKNSTSDTKVEVNVYTNETAPPAGQADPYEKFNRGAFRFNKTLDCAVIKPVAKGYNKVLPSPIKKGVANFFNNLSSIGTIFNDILQGNAQHAGADTTRFLVNTTFGIGGLIDVASYGRGKIPAHTEDTGLTFAKWGWKCSNYLVLPFFGPSTVRDTVALPIDYEAFSPYAYLPGGLISFMPVLFNVDSSIGYYAFGLNVVNKRSQLLDYENVINTVSIDEYTFIRTAYLQSRAAAIAQNDAVCCAHNPS